MVIWDQFVSRYSKWDESHRVQLGMNVESWQKIRRDHRSSSFLSPFRDTKRWSFSLLLCHLRKKKTAEFLFSLRKKNLIQAPFFPSGSTFFFPEEGKSQMSEAAEDDSIRLLYQWSLIGFVLFKGFRAVISHHDTTKSFLCQSAFKDTIWDVPL